MAHLTAALSSFAIGLVIIDLTQKVWGAESVAVTLPGALQTATVSIGGIRFVRLRLAILIISLALMQVLYLVVTRTSLGRIRAVAESPEKAALFGINVTRVNQQVFFIASMMAGLAGLDLRYVLATPAAMSDLHSASRLWRLWQSAGWVISAAR